MRNSQFIRGVGVGLLVSTLIFAVTTKQNTRPMSEQEIIRKARQLGMYTEEEVKNQKLDESLSKVDGSVKDDQNQNSDPATVSGGGMDAGKNEVSQNEVTSPGAVTSQDAVTSQETDEEDTKKQEESSPPTDVVKLTISQGMPSNEVARLLEKAGVIESASAFDRYLCNHGYENYIRSGTYTFSGEDDYETIAKVITKK